MTEYSATGILLAAGDSTRMGFPKLLYPLPGGVTPLSLAYTALVRGGVSDIVIVYGAYTQQAANALANDAPLPTVCVPGGGNRQESVYAGLLAATGDISVIHDAARCRVNPAIVRESILSAREFGSGVAALPVTDTIHMIKEDALCPLPREELYAMQTPQTFRTADIRAAYKALRESGGCVTDDASAYALAGYGKPRLISGAQENRKLTTVFDIPWLTGGSNPRVGYGEDTHRLVPDRALILGGVCIPHDTGLLGHSDADVLCHAVTDALLGAAALGDIGRHFPDTDARYQDANSIALLRQAGELLRQAGYAPGNIDAVIVAEQPRLAAYLPEMAEHIANALNLPVSAVSVKATTTEGLGFEGRGEGISARAAASVLLLG